MCANTAETVLVMMTVRCDSVPSLNKMTFLWLPLPLFHPDTLSPETVFH